MQQHPPQSPSPGKQPELLRLRGVRTHNLQNLEIQIPLGKITMVTGVSGSGKSSLVFDTLYGESYRRYVESLSSFARQYLQALPQPALDGAQNLPPAVAVKQKRSQATGRSTVGTLTELQDLLAVVFARFSQVICHQCQQPVQAETPLSIATILLQEMVQQQVWVGAPIGTWHAVDGKELKEQLQAQGFSRVFFQDKMVRLEEFPDKRLHEAILVVDRTTVQESNLERLTEALRLALQVGRGTVKVGGQVKDGEQDVSALRQFTSNFTCDRCNILYVEPSLPLFSHNHPLGACPQCQGFGAVAAIDWTKAIPDHQSSLSAQGILPWNFSNHSTWYRMATKRMATVGVTDELPFSSYSDEQWRWLRQGDGKFTGIQGYFAWLDTKRYKAHYRIHAARFRRYELCPACQGLQLNPEALACQIQGRNMAAWLHAPVTVLKEWTEAYAQTCLSEQARAEKTTLPKGKSQLGQSGSSVGQRGDDANPNERTLAFLDPALLQAADLPAAEAIEEILARLSYLQRVGLDYLNLHRQARTLSGGELQRINMSRCLGNRLTDTMFCLDEPTSGLHARDTDKLLAILRELRDQGNTVVVVEHEQKLLVAADHLLILGPKAGHQGGQLVASAPPQDIATRPDQPQKPWQVSSFSLANNPEQKSFGISGSFRHNLKGGEFLFQAGKLNAVCGVSGCGKTTMVIRVLYPAIAQMLGVSVERDEGDEGEKVPGNSPIILGPEVVASFSGVHLISQDPIGRSTRSNIATYLGIFDEIRKLLATSISARSRKLTPSHFSFNVAGGRCESCKGLGTIHEDMSFLGELAVTCPTCNGAKFSAEVLEVRYQDKNLVEILDMTVAQAQVFFYDRPAMANLLAEVARLGLDYLRLGQHTSSFSGGEAQRLKLLSALGKSKTFRNQLLILDEPSSGLSDADVEILLNRLKEICEAGNTLIVIEHHLGIIQSADWIVELGPGGGTEGGNCIFAGTSAQLRKDPRSVTGPYLKPSH